MITSKRTQPKITVTQLWQWTPTDVYHIGSLLSLAVSRACARTRRAVSIATRELAETQVILRFAFCHCSFCANGG